MRIEAFLRAIDCDFFAGVPDSQLSSFCDCVYEHFGTDPSHHVVTANEGNAIALAAGYHLATGRIGCVYMQNSGQGNAINPLVSLTSSDVYAISMILVIGWRGEPGEHDEPQHAQQGAVTLDLLDVLGIRYFVISGDTKPEELNQAIDSFRGDLENGHSVAFVVRKDAFECDCVVEYSNRYGASVDSMGRERTSRPPSSPLASVSFPALAGGLEAPASCQSSEASSRR